MRKKGSFSPSIVEHFAEVALRDQRLNPIALAIVIARRATDLHSLGAASASAPDWLLVLAACHASDKYTEHAS